MVKRMTGFYHQHRAILDSDIIHLRRPDGRDLDYILHVNPDLKEKGLLMVYNPCPVELEKEIQLPLYYTGLKATASVAERDQPPVRYELARDYSIRLRVKVPANSYSWFVITD